MLGICYGMQWLVQHFGGLVEPSRHEEASGGEYGRAELQVSATNNLFANVQQTSTVWMSHGDKVSRLPEGFTVTASSEPCPFAAVEDTKRRLFGIQFHPEVTHSAEGKQILENFICEVAGCARNWSPGDIVAGKVQRIREQVGEDG